MKYKNKNSEKLKKISNSEKTVIDQTCKLPEKVDEKETEEKANIIKKEDMKQNKKEGNDCSNEKDREWNKVDTTNLDIINQVEKQKSVEAFES